MARTRARVPGPPPRPSLPLLDTGVPGLNDVLGGGLPTLSFNVLAGGPGAGKTTLAMQMLFANATPKRPGLFITLLGETSLKTLRYQQLFDFFDATRVGTDVHFMNLTEEALTGDLEGVLARILVQIDRLHPAIVVVDSFRSLMASQQADAPPLQLEQFVQRLALHLTTWEVTSFLIGEYQENELQGPGFHHRGWHHLAHPASTPQLGRPEAPGRQGARRFAHAGAAHHSGERGRRAGLSAHSRAPHRRSPDGGAAPVHRHSRCGRDDGRRHSGRGFAGPRRPDGHRQDDIRDEFRGGRAPGRRVRGGRDLRGASGSVYRPGQDV